MSSNPTAPLVRPDSSVDENSGAYKRAPSSIRNWIEEGGRFPPQGNGRYHLYVSFACPWASRCLAFRSLKGLQEHIPVHYVHPIWGQNSKPGEPFSRGWVFKDEEYGGVRCNDPLYNLNSLRDLYELSDPNYDGKKYTVPVLWDTETKQIVNNESSEIIQMFNSRFNQFAKNPDLDLRPAEHVEEIDKLNTWMYETINNGVYKSGFARKQESYEEAYNVLFNTLDEAEAKLDKSRFLIKGLDRLCEADIRLFVTIIRFDSVYYSHFKCCKKHIENYPNLRAWLRDIYQTKGITETVNFPHIKAHYFGSHEWINPLGIIPAGPEIDYNTPHGRDSRTY